jgi:hypothetical protein
MTTVKLLVLLALAVGVHAEVMYFVFQGYGLSDSIYTDARVPNYVSGEGQLEVVPNPSWAGTYLPVSGTLQLHAGPTPQTREPGAWFDLITKDRKCPLGPVEVYKPDSGFNFLKVQNSCLTFNNTLTGKLFRFYASTSLPSFSGLGTTTSLVSYFPGMMLNVTYTVPTIPYGYGDVRLATLNGVFTCKTIPPDDYGTLGCQVESGYANFTSLSAVSSSPLPSNFELYKKSALFPINPGYGVNFLWSNRFIFLDSEGNQMLIVGSYADTPTDRSIYVSDKNQTTLYWGRHLAPYVISYGS